MEKSKEIASAMRMMLIILWITKLKECIDFLSTPAEMLYYILVYYYVFVTQPPPTVRPHSPPCTTSIIWHVLWLWIAKSGMCAVYRIFLTRRWEGGGGQDMTKMIMTMTMTSITIQRDKHVVKQSPAAIVPKSNVQLLCNFASCYKTFLCFIFFICEMSVFKISWKRTNKNKAK